MSEENARMGAIIAIIVIAVGFSTCIVFGIKSMLELFVK